MSGQYPITDDGRRLADVHEAARLAGGQGRWLAVRLSDGGTDGAVYDERADAVRHGGDWAFYIRVNPGPMPPAEGTAVLELYRRGRAAGYDFIDPAQTPIAPLSGPLPTVESAARSLANRGFHFASHLPNRRTRRGR